MTKKKRKYKKRKTSIVTMSEYITDPDKQIWIGLCLNPKLKNHVTYWYITTQN